MCACSMCIMLQQEGRVKNAQYLSGMCQRACCLGSPRGQTHLHGPMWSCGQIYLKKETKMVIEILFCF